MVTHCQSLSRYVAEHENMEQNLVLAEEERKNELDTQFRSSKLLHEWILATDRPFGVQGKVKSQNCKKRTKYCAHAWSLAHFRHFRLWQKEVLVVKKTFEWRLINFHCRYLLVAGHVRPIPKHNFEKLIMINFVNCQLEMSFNCGWDSPYST